MIFCFLSNFKVFIDTFYNMINIVPLSINYTLY